MVEPNGEQKVGILKFVFTTPSLRTRHAITPLSETPTNEENNASENLSRHHRGQRIPLNKGMKLQEHLK